MIAKQIANVKPPSANTPTTKIVHFI